LSIDSNLYQSILCTADLFACQQSICLNAVDDIHDFDCLDILIFEVMWILLLSWQVFKQLYFL